MMIISRVILGTANDMLGIGVSLLPSGGTSAGNVAELAEKSNRKYFQYGIRNDNLTYEGNIQFGSVGCIRY